MKRITALLLIFCLLLCACRRKPSGSGATTEATGNTKPTVTQPNQEDTKPTEPGSPTEPEETQPAVNRHPLTGVVLDEPWVGQAVAVMINNAAAAMPQCGISQADIFCELEVEGSSTRCLAIFTDLSNVETIGPIRSARTGFVSLATAFDAPLVHCGGSPYALDAQYGENGKLQNWEHIDEMSNGKYFFRDTERQQNGVAYEHTLFTKGELLELAMSNKNLNTPTGKTFGMQFQEGVQLKGAKAKEVVVTFKSGKTTTFVYNESTGLYKMQQRGADHIDGNTGEPVSFKNLITIYTKQWLAPTKVHKFYETIGSGEGYAAVNGTIVPILWSRADVNSPFTYTLADGTPLKLDVGTTYVAVVGTGNPISYK